MTDKQASAPALEPLANQVAGHPDGVQTLDGGRLVVKACLPRELNFYKEVKQAIAGQAGLDERQRRLLERLLQTMPECQGSWEDYLERNSASSPRTDAKTNGAVEPRIVLENLTCGYAKPNVCDIKLGTQLWDEDASEEKKERMERAAANTTSGSHGIRLTGWQTYDAETKQYHSVSKAFGKTIKAEHLELGMRMLLACPEDGDAQQAEAVLPGSSMAKDESPSLPMLPNELIEQMLRDYIIKDLENLCEIFSELAVRMRGASLLLVYEGQPDQLRKTISNGWGQPGKPQVRLIDFGHATIVPGQGPDQGVLLGIGTVLDLAKSQLKRLERQRT